MEEILESINKYMNLTRENGYFQKNRAQQAVFWMRESINNYLVSRFYDNARIKEALPLMEEKVKKGQTDSFRAASELLKLL
jgi:LAO/AO transport system kinase